MTEYHPKVAAPPSADLHEDDTRREALQTLLTRLVDAREGLDAMIDRSEPEITPVLRKIREDHHASASRVGAMIVAEGGEPDVDGSMMSTVNKAVVSIRAIFDDLDTDALDRVVEGEEHVIDAFDDAILAHAPAHDREHGELVQMRSRLSALLDEARTLAT